MSRKRTALEIKHAAWVKRCRAAEREHAEKLHDLLRSAVCSWDNNHRDICGAGEVVHCVLPRLHGGAHFPNPIDQWVWDAKEFLKALEVK